MAPTLAATTSSSSPRGVPFVCRVGERRQGTRMRAPAAAGPAPGQGCGWPLGRAAGSVGRGIACVFFASLERCSCVEISTNDDEPHDNAEAVLLMPDADGDGAAAAAETKSARGGNRTIAARGKGRRGGFGCCESIN